MEAPNRKPTRGSDYPGPLVGGRPAPPRPPSGPIARVAPTMSRAAATAAQLAALGPRVPFGLPNLRRNVCPHFYMTGPARPDPDPGAAHAQGLHAPGAPPISRCQLRGGVHLDAGYVSDICLSSRFNQCVFYEDELTGR